MSKYNSTYHLIEQAIYKDIEKLATTYSWEELADMCGYKGVNSLKNPVVQGSYKISAARFALLMKNLSKQDNHLLHKFVIDTNNYWITDNPDSVAANGSLFDEHHQLIRELGFAEDALEAGNVEKLHDYYEFLLKLTAKVKAEIGELQVMLKKEEQAGPIERILRGEKKGTPIMVGDRGFEKHNGGEKPTNCEEDQNSRKADVRQVRKKVEVTHS